MNNEDLIILEELIYSAAKRAFSKTIELHKDEKFYCFAFYTYDAFGYVLPTSSTEDGLKKAVRKCQMNPICAGESSEEELYKDLRWSPCDSPLHIEFEEEFVEATDLLVKFDEELYKLFDEDMDKHDENLLRIEDIFFKVMKRLDEENFFEKANKRENIVLNILMGDQSDEERLKNAKKLNPKIVYERFKMSYETGKY